ncbi:MAG TPA: DUF5063 domain-containing protein [Planctomycetota bacterium]|nr:DUF5063 domain-containing protein [Planctomycetota bacterium]
MLLFVEAARQYCRLIEERPVDLKTWVRALLPALSELYAYALGLTGIESVDANDRTLSRFQVTHEEWRSLYHRLSNQLGTDAWYWMTFEPMKTQKEKTEPVAGNLADDLADVYRDVAAGLRAWDTHDDTLLDEIAFQWVRGGFEIHWGAHAVDALGILHRIVMTRILSDPDPNG